MEKEDSIHDAEKLVKKHLHSLKISRTTLVILIRGLMVPMIVQVKLMVVQETWTKKIKIKRMNNSMKTPLR